MSDLPVGSLIESVIKQVMAARQRWSHIYPPDLATIEVWLSQKAVVKFIKESADIPHYVVMTTTKDRHFALCCGAECYEAGDDVPVDGEVTIRLRLHKLN